MRFTSPTPPEGEQEPTLVLPIRLRAASGEQAHGRMEGLHELVASVTFQSEDAPYLAVGATVSIDIPRQGAPGQLEATAKILSRSEEAGGGRCYDLQLPATGSVGGAVTAQLTSLFNRRQTFRVRPLPLTQVPVSIVAEGGTLATMAVLADISMGGLGLRVTHSVERKLQRIDAIHLKFSLPGSTEIEVKAGIRSRQVCGRQIRYGLRFEADGEAWSEGRREVVNYVTRRQAEDLRQAQDRSLS